MLSVVLFVQWSGQVIQPPLPVVELVLWLFSSPHVAIFPVDDSRNPIPHIPGVFWEIASIHARKVYGVEGVENSKHSTALFVVSLVIVRAPFVHAAVALF